MNRDISHLSTDERLALLARPKDIVLLDVLADRYASPILRDHALDWAAFLDLVTGERAFSHYLTCPFLETKQGTKP